MTLSQALQRRRRAERDVQDALAREYPEGAAATWRRNGIHHGQVVMVAYDRLKVRNERTGRELWIYAYDLVGATRRSRIPARSSCHPA